MLRLTSSSPAAFTPSCLPSRTGGGRLSLGVAAIGPRIIPPSLPGVLLWWTRAPRGTRSTRGLWIELRGAARSIAGILPGPFQYHLQIILRRQGELLVAPGRLTRPLHIKVANLVVSSGQVVVLPELFPDAGNARMWMAGSVKPMIAQVFAHSNNAKMPVQSRRLPFDDGGKQRGHLVVSPRIIQVHRGPLRRCCGGSRSRGGLGRPGCVQVHCIVVARGIGA